MARLDARLLAARTEVVVEVEKAARDVVATEAVEGDLGISGLEGDSEHDGDDEGAVGGDGGGPAKDGSGLLGGEEDADGPEGGSVHETGGKEEVEEEEDEPAVVLLGVLKILGLLDECSLGKGGDGASQLGLGCTVRQCSRKSIETCVEFETESGVRIVPRPDW